MAILKHALETMNFAHGLLNKMIDSVPADKGCFQPHPSSNHIVWTMGHLASTYAWLCTLLDKDSKVAVPDAYNGLFGQASRPVAEATKYPPPGEVRGVFDRTFKAFVAAVEGLAEKDLWAKPDVETNGFATSKIDGAYKCAWHDGWHLGQVADIRRALGLPSIF